MSIDEPTHVAVTLICLICGAVFWALAEPISRGGLNYRNVFRGPDTPWRNYAEPEIVARQVQTIRLIAQLLLVTGGILGVAWLIRRHL